MLASQYVERFWSKVQKGAPDECWLWTAGRSTKGYGKFSVNIKQRITNYTASRLAYALAHGDIPEGLHVCHRCDNPPCCNPAHLFLGTHAENMTDSLQKGRFQRGNRSGWRTHPERFPRGEQRRDAKLTEAIVKDIRQRVSGGTPMTVLALEFGVHPTTICRIIQGRKWRHVA